MDMILFADQIGYAIRGYEVTDEELKFTSVISMNTMGSSLRNTYATSLIMIMDIVAPSSDRIYRDYCEITSYEEHISEDDTYYEYTLRKVDKTIVTADKLTAAVMAARFYAQSLETDYAMICWWLYPEWSGLMYPIGYKVRYMDLLYQCTADGTGIQFESPAYDPDHWEIVMPEDTVMAWVKPFGINGYPINALVKHSGRTYRSNIALNVNEPGTDETWEDTEPNEEPDLFALNGEEE